MSITHSITIGKYNKDIEVPAEVDVDGKFVTKSILQDVSGNDIETHLQTDGGYHIGTAINQAIRMSSENMSTDNLAVGASFTGEATPTFGFNAIQTFLYSDQDCMLYVEQGVDGVTYEISDSVKCYANQASTRTFTSSVHYFRLRAVNIGAATTTVFKVGAGMTPVLDVLPRKLSTNGYLQCASSIRGDENNERHAWVTPDNNLSINTNTRLVGTTFDGTVKDPNFWTETITNGGSVVQNGEIKLQTNTTANGTAKYQTVQRARFVIGSTLIFRGIYKFNDTVTELDNIRRFGAYDDDNGFFIQLDSGAFSVGSRKGASDTLINTGSFNGNLGSYFTPSPTAYYRFDIEYTPLGVFYYINGILLHKSVGGHLTRFLTLPLTMENINDNANATSVIMDCLGSSISRQGKLSTSSVYKYIGTNATTLCKVGAGFLSAIINNDNSGNYQVYDGLDATGSLIADIDSSKVLGSTRFDCPFSDGLTIVTALGSKLTITYE